MLLTRARLGRLTDEGMSLMKRCLVRRCLGVAAAAIVLPMTYAASMAQTSPIPANPQIDIAYVPPTSAEFMPIYGRLKDRKVLETLQQFLAPLKIDRKLLVKFDQCDDSNVRLKRQEATATICYDYVEKIGRLVPQSTVLLAQGPVTSESALVGPVVQALLHEVAIAVFDILQIPVWGRMDDAADRVAAFILLQFGPDVAWNSIVGFAWFLSGNALAPPDFADVRGLVVQRYYTTICLAAAGEARGMVQFSDRSFRSFVARGNAGDLPAGRAESCIDEFDTLRQGFNDSIMPHIDQPLLERVRKEKWINFGDAR